MSEASGPPRLGRPPGESLRRQWAELEVLEWRAPLWRIQKGAEPNYRIYENPRYRFDAPGGQYAAVYTNDSWLGVFGEVYVDRRGRRMGMGDRSLHLVRITAGRPLRIVDLRSNKTLSALGLDARISTGEDYEVCQTWALALHGAFPEIDGLRYAPRKAGEEFSNAVLFAGRCADALAYSSQGRLEELDEVVLAASDEYKLRPVFLVR